MAEAEKPITFVLSDESLNSYGFWVKTSGIDLKQFKKNPVMLFEHIRTGEYRSKKEDIVFPIGYWENIRVEGTELKADAVFDPDDKFAQEVKSKVKNRVLRMASIGFDPLQFSQSKADIKPGQSRATVSKSELKESSIVTFGSNKNAMATLSNKHNPKTSGIVPELKLNNNKIQTEMELSELLPVAILLGLSEKPDEISPQLITSAVKKLSDRNTELENENKTLSLRIEEADKKEKESRLKDLEKLMNAKKLTDPQKESFRKLAANDFDTTYSSIELLPTPTALHDYTNTDGGEGDDEDYEGACTFDMKLSEIRKNN